MKLLNFFKKKNNLNSNPAKCNEVNQEYFEFLLTWTIYGEDKTLYKYTDFRLFTLKGIETYVKQKELEFKEMAVSKNCCIHFSFKHLREIIAVTLGNSTSPSKEEIRVIDNTYLGHWDDGLIVVTPGGGPWRLR